MTEHWQQPRKLEPLAAGVVHVWQARLDTYPSLSTFLSADEQARAERLRAQEVRERFVAGRSWLRSVLGRYLEAEPGQVCFRYGPQGKPQLPGDGLRFNLTHSHGLALIAVGQDREVGIDVEAIRLVPDLEGLAARYFSPEEVRSLQQVPVERRTEAFFLCWTRKEAYVKATGAGLGQRLDRFTVSLIPGGPARLLDVADDPDELGRWSMHDLNPAAGFAAALVVQGQGCIPICQHWPEDWCRPAEK